VKQPTKRKTPKGRTGRSANFELSARQKAYRYIQQAIANGEIAGGESLSELELAGKLRSSRTPIREAIGQLVAEGLLQQIRNHGTTVIQLTRDDIVDLYELRQALEIFAAGKVAHQGAPKDDLDHLQQLVDAILPLREELAESGEDALSAEQMGRFTQTDLSFHSLLMLLALNPRMQKIANEAQLLIRIFAIRRRGHNLNMLDKIHAQHGGIVQALRDRQSEQAIRILSEHIQVSLEERLEEFDAWNRARAMRREMPDAFAFAHGGSR